MKKNIVVAIVLILLLTVSCSPDFFQKTGNLLNKTGVPVFGTDVDVNTELKNVKDLDNCARISDLIEEIRNAKTSPVLLKALYQELDKPYVPKDEARYQGNISVTKALNYIFDVSANLEENYDKIASATDIFKINLQKYEKEEATLEESLKLVPGIGKYINEDNVFVFEIIGLFADDILSLLSNAKKDVMAFLGPYLGALDEMSNTYSVLLASMPKDSSDLTVRGYLNSVISEEYFAYLLSGLFGFIFDDPSAASLIGGAVSGLDALCVINSDIQITELINAVGNAIDN